MGFDRYAKSAKLSEVGLIMGLIVENQVSFYQRPRLYEPTPWSPSGITEMHPCFVRLGYQPDIYHYVIGDFDFPLEIDTTTYAGARYENWGAIGWPTRSPVYFSYAAYSFSTSGRTPYCEYFNSPSFVFRNYLYVVAQGDLDKDNTLSYLQILMSVDESGNINVGPLENPNPNQTEFE